MTSANIVLNDCDRPVAGVIDPSVIVCKGRSGTITAMATKTFRRMLAATLAIGGACAALALSSGASTELFNPDDSGLTIDLLGTTTSPSLYAH